MGQREREKTGETEQMGVRQTEMVPATLSRVTHGSPTQSQSQTWRMLSRSGGGGREAVLRMQFTPRGRGGCRMLHNAKGRMVVCLCIGIMESESFVPSFFWGVGGIIADLGSAPLLVRVGDSGPFFVGFPV